MPLVQLLNTPDDVEWLRSTHCPSLPAVTKSFLLHGNEDCPVKVAAFEVEEPLLSSRVIAFYTANDEGDLVLVEDGVERAGGDVDDAYE